MTDNSTAWVQIRGEDVKVGDTVRVMEKAKDVTVTYEGQVTQVLASTLKIGNPELYYTSWKTGSGAVGVTVYRQPPELPKRPGTVVKAYDVRYLEDAAFCLGDDGKWWGMRQGRSTTVASEQLAAWGYEILFEPGS